MLHIEQRSVAKSCKSNNYAMINFADTVSSVQHCIWDCNFCLPK